jgi:crossover junction endodeoxyribonuclease RusA
MPELGKVRQARQEWELVLPFQRPLSLNHRQHHMVKARAVAEWRQAAMILARKHKIPRCEKVEVTLIYRPADARRRDPLNLVASLKALQDGLVDAKVVPDDTPQYMHSPMPLIDASEKGQPTRISLLVTRIA